jgi:RHS repeat-associated protein
MGVSPANRASAFRPHQAETGITAVDIGHFDNVAPNAISSVSASPFRDRVDLQWPATTDDTVGTGVYGYAILRNGTQIGETTGTTFADFTAGANNTFTYTVQAVDFHANATSTTASVTTPASTADPREVGVRPLDAYWGAAGEQIDMRSGNLNYTMPILKAMGRGGKGVGFALNYNSQNWRQDSAGTWQLGLDTGYGYGWRLQAGSLTPLYNSAWSLAGYLFIDSTGAEYILNNFGINNAGWWSKEGLYVTAYNQAQGQAGNLQYLSFPDGSIWIFGSTAAGSEEDAGTLYPTKIKDGNGNMVQIKYSPGVGQGVTNTSSRIATIEDVRGNGSADYTFTYTLLNPSDPFPHLTSITNSVGSSENYSFSYVNSTLNSPFNGASYGTFAFQTSMTQTGVPLTTSFTYDSAGSGELDQATTPYGGHLRWTYTPYTLANTLTYREVQYRYLSQASGASETSVQLIRGNDSSYNVHPSATLDDLAANAEKYWSFQTDNTQFNLGLQLTYEERQLPSHIALQHLDFTWAQTPTSSEAYIGTVLTTLDPGQSYQAQKNATQTLDVNGNLTQVQVYDFGNLSTPVRTYTNTYGRYFNTFYSNYVQYQVANMRLTGTVTDGTNTASLVSNTFDGTSITSLTGLYEHDDGDYPATFTQRGNITSSTTPTSSVTNYYDLAGNLITTTNNAVSTSITLNSTTNFVAPSQMTTNSLSSSATWSTFLGLSTATGPNSDQSSITYDSNARPQTATSPYGAVTTYTYNDSSSAPNSIATTNGHWIKRTMDGFGRTIETDTGNGTTTVSSVQSVYAPCGSSPLGTLTRTSEPYAPNGTIYWKTYAYDASGRTTSVTLPDGSATTYLYQGNTVKVTDPAGKWKIFTMDAFGNLKSVTEPDPALGNVTTSYTYDILNHLTGVSMPRGSNAQTRSFNYTTGTTVGGFLLSATNPETGTVTYTYDSSNRLATKTDAKGQQFTYTYDTYNRVTKIKWVNAPGGSQTLRTFSYDTNPYDPQFSGAYTQGRLAAVVNQQFQPGKSTSPSEIQFVESYAYTQPGQMSGKRLAVAETLSGGTPVSNLDALYTYDNEGSMTSVSYPSTSAGAGPTYTYSYDNMHRPTGLTDQNNNTDVTGVQYGPSDQLLAITYLGANETRQYNNLMQLTQLTATGSASLSYTYNYPTGTNNGKISSQVVSGETITYQYDSVNRLISATSSASWGENYGYDAFGSLVSKAPTAGSPPTLSIAVNPANNQIVGQTYDGNGNELSAPAGGSLTYDSENRLLTAPGVQYGYDSSNKRVWAGTLDGNGNLTAQTAFVYGVSGQMLGEYSITVGSSSLTVTATVLTNYFGAKRIGTTNSAGVSTALGSDRLQSAGQYYPYGEGKGGNNPADAWSFATYWRDSATGLDYANERHYSNQYGRFMRPDPFGGSSNSGNPQSWNSYAYVLGDPVNLNDPTGLMECADCGEDGGSGDGYCPPEYESCAPLGGGGPVCTPGTAFAQSACDGGSPPPPPPPQPTCEIGLFYRAAVYKHLPWHHDYLADTCTYGSFSITVTIQADPGPIPKWPNAPKTPPNYYGTPWLIGVIGPVGTGPGNSNPNAPGNYQVGTWKPIAFEQLVSIGNAVLNYDYNYAAPYSLFPYDGYNSNSFIGTLVRNFNLGFPNPPGSNPGWKNNVPNLGP